MLWRFTWTDRVVIIQLGKMEGHTPSVEVFRTEIRLSIASNFAFAYIHEDFNKEIVHTHAQLPSTFLVDRESRYETLKHYKLAFQLPDQESRIYFRQGADIPCINWHNLETFKDCPEMAEAEELMIIAQGYIYDHDVPLGQSIFLMSKVDDDSWSEAFFSQTTGHKSECITTQFPKIQSLYWTNEYVYDVDPWMPRTTKKQRPGLTASVGWTPNP